MFLIEIFIEIFIEFLADIFFSRVTKSKFSKKAIGLFYIMLVVEVIALGILLAGLMSKNEFLIILGVAFITQVTIYIYYYIWKQKMSEI